MTKISTFKIDRLRNDESYTFHKAVSELASTLDTDSVKPFAATYADAFDKLRVAIDQSAGHSSAANAKEADIARDNAWRGCNAYIRAVAAYHPNEEIRAAAAPLSSLFEKYGNPTQLSLAEETGVLDNLVESIEAQGAQTVEKAGFAEWLADLKAKQAAYEAAAKANIDEKAGKVLGAVKTARSARDEAYGNLTIVINTLVMMQGEAAFSEFISRVNVIVEQQKIVFKHRNSMKKQSAEAAETETTKTTEEKQS